MIHCLKLKPIGLVILSLLVFVFLAVGCHRKPTRPADLPELTPCTISVTFGGEVIEGVGIILIPEDTQINKWRAGGKTDNEGRATMITSSVFDGVVPGNYVVSFKKLDKPVGMQEPPSLIPKKYLPNQSKETITVTKEQKEYVFELEGLK
ncbi:MAG: hypothetical protein LBI18_01630 [Planctomycetaceae bacterium]|jgi:hypothetical protein|nr:hypothetical protein [Planctomycetaceae bacterium]